MTTAIPSRVTSRTQSASLARQFFASPPGAGRKITAGFTYLQRIAKAGTYEVWFPESLREALDTRIALGQKIGPDQFPAEWAAIRQFELLQEAGNHKIYDLDPGNIQRATLDLSRSMRAGGVRVTVATLGHYTDTSTSDELEILDAHLQERISKMIHMLYLDEPSAEENLFHDTRLASGCWDYRNDLPHIGMLLGAHDLFCDKKKKKSGTGDQRAVRARQFFDIVGQLSQNHILHDTAIGLQLPELNGENQWNYIASPDETLAAFNRVLGDLFDKFNGVSLGRLQGNENAGGEIKSSTFHLRGYGHPLRDSELNFYRSASLALN